MFTRLDQILFVDKCQVYEIIPKEEYVYPIYKNARSAFDWYQRQKNWKIVINDQIKRIDNIKVYLRNPYERYISGVWTHLQNLIKEDPTLDENTILKLIKTYQMLDRHYCPQYLWLCNLARYMNKSATIEILDIASVDLFGENKQHIKPFTGSPTKEFKDSFWKIDDNDFLKLDEIIRDNFMNKRTTIKEINLYIKNQHIDLYKRIFNLSIELKNQHDTRYRYE